jgi:Fe-S cluster assembly protein SufD
MTTYPPASVPSPEEEIWRYSRIADLDLAAFAPAPITATVSGWKVDGDEPAGHDDGEPPADVFAELNASYATPLVVRIPRGHVAADPIEVVWSAPAGGAAVFPRLIVEAGEDSEVTVVERFASADGAGPALVVPVTELRAGPAARLRYLAVNDIDAHSWQIANQLSRGARDSYTLLSTVALGGYYARVRTDARLDGQGSTCEQIAVYYGDGDQMLDFRTLQDHAAPKTTSDLLFKGAVQDRARSVYTGLIRVRKEAPGTNAFQTNRNLKLSDGAWADSVPNLEIENNDVRCSHASAVGPIDAEQRFYLESRGVPPETAERLIVLGFFDEVLERLPAPHVVPDLRRAIAAKLDRRQAQ